MYNQAELDALAKSAQMQLNEQSGEGSSNNEQDIDDIYANIFEDDESDNQHVQYSEESEYHEDDEEYYDDTEAHLINEYVELDTYDEVLYKGGPTKSQLNLWRKEWDGYDICLTEILDQAFVFRTLNRFEYKQLVAMKNTDALQREEIVCQTVTLWPQNISWENMAAMRAGLPSTYSEIIMEKSGFTKDYAVQVL